jgi:hypothetical protein
MARGGEEEKKGSPPVMICETERIVKIWFVLVWSGPTLMMTK